MSHSLATILEDAFVARGVEFDAEKHRYFHDGKRLPGVTTILGVIAKPALVQWSANLAVEHVRNNLTNLVQLEAVLNEARVAHRAEMGAGADIGSAAHDAIHIWASGEVWDAYLPDEPMARAATEAALDWMQWHSVSVEASEALVCDPTEFPRWGGTLDLLASVNKRLWLVDFKTNRSGVYAEHVLQVAAYAAAVEGLTGAVIDKTVVVHCSREGAGFAEVARNRGEWRGDARLFDSALHLYAGLKPLAKLVRDSARGGE